MGKKEEDGVKENKGTEGKNLLGRPKFKKLENGRFRCVETGHELPAHAKDSYSQTKHCRLGLINAALARNKPPLNMFNQDPQSPSKLVCKLTGVIINKSEDHIWKHINGKKFLNTLEKKEAEESETPNEMIDKKDEPIKEKKSKPKADGAKKRKNTKEKSVREIISKERDSSDKDIDLEGAEFWMPPVGERWDFDDGGDQLAPKTDDGNREDGATTDSINNAKELSKRTKRKAKEIGPSSCATRKKKKKKKNSTK